MADTGSYSWGPGDGFHASVFALSDGAKISGARVTARIYDKDLKPVLSETWALTVPSGGHRSEAREILWHIPANTPERQSPLRRWPDECFCLF